MSDTRMRSIAKMLSYRVAVIALLAAVTFYFTGNAGEATAISIVFNVAGSVVYYGYERMWDSIAWGKVGGDLNGITVATAKPIAKLPEDEDETQPVPTVIGG